MGNFNYDLGSTSGWVKFFTHAVIAITILQMAYGFRGSNVPEARNWGDKVKDSPAWVAYQLGQFLGDNEDPLNPMGTRRNATQP